MFNFRKDPILSTIVSTILAAHCLFLLFLLVSPSFVFKKKQHKPLIVKTITPKPASKMVAEKKPQRAETKPVSAPKPAAPKAETPKPSPQVKKDPPPKPTPVKKEAPKTPIPKKEPAIADKTASKSKTPAKTPPPQNRAKISDSLLQELEKSIADLDNKNAKIPVNKKPADANKRASPITLQIDVPDSANDTEEMGDYTQTLVGYLHSALSLPDYGEVKIQLSLRQDGSVAKLAVLKAQSEKNKQYLESNLSRLKFPRFDGAFASKKEHTFVLTFCNE